MELQRCQQQSYSDKTSIKQLQDKLSQADNAEREWMTKFNREKEKVNEHYEKITIIENTVSSLEKQNRDYVVEIEVWSRFCVSSMKFELFHGFVHTKRLFTFKQIS